MKKEKYGVIYLIKNKINNKIYIGQTVNTFDERYKGDLQKYTHNIHLKRSIEEYGIENFYIDKEFDVAYSKEELDKLEDMYIKIYNTTDKKYGYNMMFGGSNGKHTEESKAKISESNKGENNHFYGKSGIMSPVSKRVICLNDNSVFDTCKEASVFYNVDRSTLTKVCNKKVKQTKGYYFMYYDEYMNLSEEQKEEIANSDFKHITKTKKIICLDDNKIFNSISEASNYYGVSGITKVCNKVYKQTKGLHFMYYDEYIKKKGDEYNA